MKRPISFVAAVLLVAACSGTALPSPSPEPATAAAVPTSAPVTAAPPASVRPTSVPPASASPVAAQRTPPPFALLPALPTGKLDATTAAALQKVLDDLVAQGAPDAIAAVITADGHWSGAAGVDGPKGRLADPADQFGLISGSKTVLATLILRLVQDGRMDLDTPLASYLGNLPVDANGATVRQALGMRSGIGVTPSELVAEAGADCGRVWAREELVPSIPTPHASPGVTVEYSNPTYKLLALAAEHVTGTSLEAAYHDEVFAPAGIKGMVQQGPARATRKPWALPIAGHEGKLGLADFGKGGMLPCASIETFSIQNAVAGDAPSVARFGWSLFSGELLDRDSLTAMTTVTAGDSPDDPDLYGLGIGRVPDFFYSALAYGMGGSEDGYSSFVAILPERQAVVVLFSNDRTTDNMVGTRELVRALGG